MTIMRPWKIFNGSVANSIRRVCIFYTHIQFIFFMTFIICLYGVSGILSRTKYFDFTYFCTIVLMYS